jgi:hypothetical protein
MPLKYARFTYFSESDKGEELRTSKKKTLMSNEPLPIRGLFRNQESIDLKSIFVVATNYLHKISVTDHGSWRREAIYNTKMMFTRNPDPNNAYQRQDNPALTMSKSRDPDFLSAFMSISTMMLGLLDLMYGGLIDDVPRPTIDRETNEYRKSQDSVHMFIMQRMVRLPEDRGNEYVPLTAIIDTYCIWYESNVKNRRQDRGDLITLFRNSSISSYVSMHDNGVVGCKGVRAAASDSDVGEGESWLYVRADAATPEAAPADVPDVLETKDDGVIVAAPDTRGVQATLAGPASEAPLDMLNRLYSTWQSLLDAEKNQDGAEVDASTDI